MWSHRFDLALPNNNLAATVDSPHTPVVRAILAAFACLLALPAEGARLPFRAYGPAEGLEGNYVRFVMQDARGFLWVATNAGVSRFDGHEFRNYGAADGLPFPSARKIVETTDGGLIVLGRGKLARRAPGFSFAGPEFAAVDPPGLVDRAGDIYDVAVAPDGSVVAGGTSGIVRLTGDEATPIDLGPTPHAALQDAETVWAVAYDGSGALWVARTYGITRVGSDGVSKTLVLPPERQVSSGWGWLPSMMTDRSKRVWLLTVERGSLRLDQGPDGVPIVAEVLVDVGGVRGWNMRALHESPDGTFWVGTSNAALVRVERTPTSRRSVRVGAAEGFPDVEVSSLVTDAQGNLWVGTAESGLVRLAGDGLTSWGESEGLRPVGVGAILDDPEGGVIALVGGINVAAVRGGRIEGPWPARGVSSGWGGQQLVARDAGGRLWVATGKGPAVYPRGTRLVDLRSRAPERILGEADGLSGREVHRLFATSDGTIWVGLIHTESGVCRVDPRGGVRCFGPRDGLPEEAWGSAFAQDARGHVWAGFYGGGVSRFRDGRFESWPELAPARQSHVESIRRDRAGRLWVAGSPGLLRIDGAETDRPTFRRYTREDGLGSADTFDTAEDRFGDLYVSGPRGVDRIDPEGGTIRRYTSADGLPSNRAAVLHVDPRGDLWVGTTRGLAHLVPARAEAPASSPVYVTAATVAGRPRAASGPLELDSDERTVEFGFTSPSFRAGETMRFQWRLVGGGEEWSLPSTARSIVLAGLAPGRYRFEVRAVDGEGSVSAPATVAFRIPPPFWQRGWFLGLASFALAGILLALYRVRVARLLELERVRTRIATDLHDDVGSSLSQIAVLSQYARRQAARGGEEVHGSLARITELSGGVVDAMSDVVWSINPARDRMSDLVHRMRRFAVDLFSETDATLTLDLPADDADEPLAPEIRRQVFLVFKEALRNAARHAKASAVSVGFRREREGLVLCVADDGQGITASSVGSSTGLGLRSMGRRAAAIGGTLEVTPAAGGGTEVRLRIPTSGRRYLSKWTGARTERAS